MAPASPSLSTNSNEETVSPVHLFKTICGKEEALDFGMTRFEGTAVKGKTTLVVFVECVESQSARLLISEA